MRGVLERARRVKLLVLDVDGVLTDGRIVMDEEGREVKLFHVRDGHGIKMLLRAGVEVALFSGRTSEAVKRRAEDLGVRYLFQGLHNKVAPFEELKERLELEDDEVCFVGDDLVDIPLLRRVGLPVVVGDGVEEAKRWALYITELPGGKGAVREVCELILKAQGKWEGLLKRYEGV